MNKLELNNLRGYIDGELNRIAVSDDIEEVDMLYGYLQSNIEKYYLEHRKQLLSSLE